MVRERMDKGEGYVEERDQGLNLKLWWLDSIWVGI